MTIPLFKLNLNPKNSLLFIKLKRRPRFENFVYVANRILEKKRFGTIQLGNQLTANKLGNYEN